MVEQKKIWTCGKCGRIGSCHFFEHNSDKGKFCCGKVVPKEVILLDELKGFIVELPLSKDLQKAWFNESYTAGFKDCQALLAERFFSPDAHSSSMASKRGSYYHKGVVRGKAKEVNLNPGDLPIKKRNHRHLSEASLALPKNKKEKCEVKK